MPCVRVTGGIEFLCVYLKIKYVKTMFAGASMRVCVVLSVCLCVCVYLRVLCMCMCVCVYVCKCELLRRDLS